MTRPLTGIERTAGNKRAFYENEERVAREKRGETGAMEAWLRITRSLIAKEVKAGRADVLAAFALVCRLFMAAVEKRNSGDHRLWDDLIKYAHAVVEGHTPDG